jgi:flagellar motility protein MotE (MotC chaperone)
MLIVLDEQRKKIAEQKELIKTLEKNVNYLKKTERMRENFNELWIQEIKLYHQETSNKIVLIDKKMKKLEKNLKQYE